MALHFKNTLLIICQQYHSIDEYGKEVHKWWHNNRLYRKAESAGFSFLRFLLLKRKFDCLLFMLLLQALKALLLLIAR